MAGCPQQIAHQSKPGSDNQHAEHSTTELSNLMHTVLVYAANSICLRQVLLHHVGVEVQLLVVSCLLHHVKAWQSKKV